MKLLIAPLHYVADNTEGSEYSRAYDYAKFLSTQNDITADVLVGYTKEEKLNGLNFIRFFKKKPSYISNFMRLRFVLWVFFKSIQLQLLNKYDLIWHNGPFALNETFSLVSIFNLWKTPLLIGPINVPHSFIGVDESRSMGRKDVKTSNRIMTFLKFFDEITYSVSKVFSKMSYLTLQRATLVLAKENECQRLLKGMGITNSLVFNAGIDIKKHKKAEIGKTKGKFRLLNVSYLVERKRTIDLILLMDYLVHTKNKQNYFLTIVGDGPQKKVLQETIDRLALEKYVKLEGYKSKLEILKYYSNSDLFVSATQSDTMPAMYFEAISSGLVLVTYSNPSIEELSSIGVNCRTVKFGDYQAMAEQIDSLASNLKKLTTISASNYDLYYQSLSFSKRMNDFKDILNKLVISNLK